MHIGQTIINIIECVLKADRDYVQHKWET